MKKHTFYIGLNDKDTKSQLISTLDAYRITTNILGVDSTIKECKGVYTHEDGTITTENTLESYMQDTTDDFTSEAYMSDGECLDIAIELFDKGIAYL